MTTYRHSLLHATAYITPATHLAPCKLIDSARVLQIDSLRYGFATVLLGRASVMTNILTVRNAICFVYNRFGVLSNKVNVTRLFYFII